MHLLWVTDRAKRARWAKLVAANHNPRTTIMEQLTLPVPEFTVDVESFIGLTAWVLTSVRSPPTVGWWKTRRVSSPNMFQPQRRWWNGSHFSRPVAFGEADRVTEDLARELTFVRASDIEWCGLKQPHPSPYPYRLMSF